MKIPYEDFDLSGIRTYPLKSRKSKAHIEAFARPYVKGSGIDGVMASLISKRWFTQSRMLGDRTAPSFGASARTSSKPAYPLC
jgi:hypothetical protein